MKLGIWIADPITNLNWINWQIHENIYQLEESAEFGFLNIEQVCFECNKDIKEKVERAISEYRPNFLFTDYASTHCDFVIVLADVNFTTKQFDDLNDSVSGINIRFYCQAYDNYPKWSLPNMATQILNSDNINDIIKELEELPDEDLEDDI